MEITDSGIILDARPALLQRASLLDYPDMGYVLPRSFGDTTGFREEALKFTKYGYYCPDPQGTAGYKRYWDEQLRRCIEGYEVDGIRVTGDHYGYLNFAQIRITDDEGKKNSDVTKKRAGQKKVFFPDFYDGDYVYFHEVEQARLAGEHMIVAKARRKGYSYKNGWIAANRYNTLRNSVTLLGAYQKDYLYPEGTMAMASNYLDFLNLNTAWKKRRKVVNKIHHRKASFIETFPDGTEVERGYKSQILAITFKNNPEAARGKDGTLIIFEEAGKFIGLKAAYMATRPTVEDGDTVTGQIIVFGTGGGTDSNWEDFEEMFYSPKQFGMRAYDNTYDEGASGTSIGFFVPHWWNKRGFMDKTGNSDKVGAQQFEDAIIAAKKSEGASSANVDAHTAEYPNTPAEAFMRIGTNIFPQTEILQHFNYLKTSKIHLNLGVSGDLVKLLTGKIVFRPTERDPLYKFPHDRDQDQSGTVVIYQAPVKINNEVPDNLYYICHDPYAHNQSTGPSLGAAYVMKRVSTHRPDDQIVAGYVGRPATQDMYNEILFKLAQYYNCLIGFENDRGDVIGYAKRTKQLDLLESEFELDYAKNLKSSVNREYGMHMTTERKLQGAIYLRDWLLKKRGKTADGKTRLNLHTIMDPALLMELLKYNSTGNFDRVSALLVGMYYMKELEIGAQNSEPVTQEEESIFHRQLFV